MATEPILKVPKVRHAVNAAHHIHWENAQYRARNVINEEIKTTLVLVVGQSRKALRTVRDYIMAGAQWDTLKVGADSPSQDPEADPTPEVSTVLSWTHFKTILSSMGDSLQISMRERDYPVISMGVTPFKTLRKVLIMSQRHFHSIYRSRLVLSTSNEMDPDSKTKILMILKVKLPHQDIIDNMQVKVDDSAEANIFPLDSFRTMFPHALDEDGYPKTGFLERSNMNLECYDDGRLINHGCIKLRLQHYLEKSFQHHILCCRDKDSKRDHHRAPSKCQVRSHSCIMWECIQVHFSHRKQWEYQLQQLLPRPSTKCQQQAMTEEAEKQIWVILRPFLRTS